MRCFKRILLIVAAILFIASCDKNKQEDPEPVIPKGSSYVGILTVDQNDGTFYVDSGVNVVVSIEEAVAEIKMLKVSFSPNMPIKLDMTIAGVNIAEVSDGFLLSGENIIPWAMDGEFPQYTITGMTGKVTPLTINFEMTCGEYPVTFAGEIETGRKKGLCE